MIGKIIGAAAGAKVADHVRGLDAPGGALLGVGVVALMRRFGPWGIIAALVGSYALKRYSETRDQPGPKPASKPRARRPAARPRAKTAAA